MKYIRIVGIFALCVLTYVNNFSFAQSSVDEAYCATSPVCGTTPPKYMLLLDFVREMTNSIKTIGTQGNYVGKYVNPNRFEGQNFVPPKTSLVGKLAQNVQQKILFGVATTAIVTTPVALAGFQDFFGSMILLGKNEAFLRDAKITNQLLSQVNDKRYELGLGGGRYDVINEPNRKQMNTIIDTYIKKGLLLDGSKVKENTEYNAITSILVKTLTAAKMILYSGSTDQFTTLTRGGSDGIVLVFDSNTILQIQKDYACAAGIFNVCSKALHKFSSSIDSFWADSMQSWTRTKSAFTGAVDKIKNLFLKEKSDEFEAREAELLTSLYGTTKLSDKRISAGAEVDGDDLATIATTATGLVNRFVDSSETAFYAVKKLNQLRTYESKDSPLSSSSSTTPLNQDLFKQMLAPYIQDVLIQQQKDISLITLSEVQTVTPAFSSLAKKIITIRENILGGKDKDGSLIKNLGKACDLQCGRGGLCY